MDFEFVSVNILLNGTIKFLFFITLQNEVMFIFTLASFGIAPCMMLNLLFFIDNGRNFNPRK